MQCNSGENSVTCELLLLSKNRVTGIERYAFDTMMSATGHYRVIVGNPTEQSRRMTFLSRQRGWPVEEIHGPAKLSEQIAVGRRLNATHTIGVHYFSVAPGIHRSSLPFTITIYDVSAWRYPQFMSRGMRYLYRPLIEKAIQSPLLRGVVTISKFSKQEIHEVLGVPLKKIFVVYPPRPNVIDGDVIGSCAEANSYFLHVGTIEPRKNISMVIRSFQQACLQDVKLYLVGRLGWSKLPDLPRNVHYLGSVDDETLKRLYEGARAVISASYYEGFGLPPAEALIRGSIVFLNDIPIYRELYSDNANVRFFDDDESLIQLFRSKLTRHSDTFVMPVLDSFDKVIRNLFGGQHDIN